jgi:hypothetical protein
MSTKPKKSEYKASAAEKASAAVAMAEHKYFKEKYDPLLQKERDASLKDDSARILKGRANADTMQTLAGSANYDRAAQGSSGGDEAQAYQAQLGQAATMGLDIKNKRQLAVLGTARGQQADASGFMSSAANMGASRVLTKAAAKQTVRSAKTKALGEIGTSLIMQGAKNKSSKRAITNKDADGNQVPQMDAGGNQMFERGSFFTPMSSSGSVTGFGNRLNHSGYMNTNPWGR